MLNIWDWELLSDSDLENRLQNWVDKHYLFGLREGIAFTEDETRLRHQEISKNLIFWLAASLQQVWLDTIWFSKTRLFRTWYQDLNDDKKLWINARGKIRLLLNNEKWIDNFNGPTISASWTVPTSFWSLKLIIGGEENGIGICFCCGIFALWLFLENIISRKWADRISKYRHERTTGIRFLDGYIVLAFWWDEYGYAKWRGVHIMWNIIDFLLGKQDYQESFIERLETTLELPEGIYPIEVKLYQAVWKRSRSPFVEKVNRCRLIPTKIISIPGKGENDYDIDDDAIYNLTISADTVEEAIAYLREDILKARRRYGGD